MDQFGNGISILSENQCEVCYLKNASAEFSPPDHSGCVAQSECPANYWGNPTTNSCETCTGKYVNFDHSSCIDSKEQCGDGRSVINNSNQCENCSKKNSSAQFSLADHSGCVAQVECPAQFWGNPSTMNCEDCSVKNNSAPYSLPDHTGCVDQSSCPATYWGNPVSKNCESCSGKFVKADHSGCIESKRDCGDGKSVLNSNQCEECAIKNASAIYSLPDHTGCAAQIECPATF